MRKCLPKPAEEMQVDQINLELKSRDDIPQILRGLQYIFLDLALRGEVLKILGDLFPQEVDLNNGRPGMDRWSIFVMGVLRLNLNCDYDRLHNLVNNHKTIRQILGHGLIDDQKNYCLQTLKDNVRLLTPEILDKINQIVVHTGHDLIKKTSKRRIHYYPLILHSRVKISKHVVTLLWLKRMLNIPPMSVCSLTHHEKSLNC